MSRGRPKGSLNKSTLAKLNSTSTSATPSPSTLLSPSTPSIPTPSLKSQKKLDTLPKCTCCNTPITCTPYRLNLTYLTGGIAPYHRNLKIDNPVLCDKCAKGLNKVIEDYLVKMGAEKKF